MQSVLNNVKNASEINPAAGALYRQDSQRAALARSVIGGTKQSDDITITGGDVGTTYTVSVGVDAGSRVSVSYVGSASAATIAQNLVALLNAKIGISNLVFATQDTTKITLTARVAGDTYSAASSVSGASGTIGAVTPVTTAADALPVFAGRFVEASSYTGAGGSQLGLKSFNTGTYTAQVAKSVDIDDLAAIGAGDVISITINGDFDGKGLKDYSVTVPYASSEADTITQTVAALNGILPAGSVLVANASGVLTLTSELAGVGFTVTGYTTASGAYTAIGFSESGTVANAAPAGAGIVRRSSAMQMTAAGEGRFTGGMSPTVLTEGEVWVELDSNATIAIGDPVFVRRVATGTEVTGAFRGAQDGTDCVPLTALGFKGYWLTGNQTGFFSKNTACLSITRS